MWLAVTHELEAPDTANKAHVWEQRMRRVAAPAFPVLGEGWSSLAAPHARAQVSLACCSRIQACGNAGLAAGWGCHTSPVPVLDGGASCSPEPLEGKLMGGQHLSLSAPHVLFSITKGDRAQIWAKDPPSAKAGCALILVIPLHNPMCRDLPG